MLRRTAALLTAALLLGPWGARAGADEPAAQDAREAAEAAASAAFFARGEIPDLHLEVAPEDVARLRAAPRTYVRARLRVGAQTYEGVGVKLKGAAGSFRDVDDRPCLTLDLDRHRPQQRFHGLAKLHLNNSVQDPTWVQEALCAGLFADAGLVAPRVAHAHLRWNERDLGLYVLKEGVDRRFLARHFGRSDGTLYDGGFCQDLDAGLRKDLGEEPEDRSDLAALVAACREPDLEVRASRLPLLLDVEAFLSFVALERMTSHWDGYCGNLNNYRVYLRPPGGEAVFLPQGLDQMFGDTQADLLAPSRAIVADAVLGVPAWRAAYRARVKSLLPLFHAGKSLLPRTRRLAARVLPSVERQGPAAVEEWLGRLRDLEAHLRARADNLREQADRVEPPVLAFDERGEAHLGGWTGASQEGEPRLVRERHAGRDALAIGVGPQSTVASWRRRVVLSRGRYVLRAEVAVNDVAPRADPQGSGAGLRISGAARTGGHSGSHGWHAVEFSFDVHGGLRQVELVLELRAEKGTAWFDAGSLRLVRDSG